MNYEPPEDPIRQRSFPSPHEEEEWDDDWQDYYDRMRYEADYYVIERLKGKRIAPAMGFLWGCPVYSDEQIEEERRKGWHGGTAALE